MGLLKKLRQMTGGVDGDLLADGVLGRGIIMGCQPGATTVKLGVEEYRVCDLHVQVFIDGRWPSMAQVRQRVPVWLLGQLQPGAVAVAVRVDPDDESHVAVDFATEPPVPTLAPPPPGTGAPHVLAHGLAGEAVVLQHQPLGVRSFRGHEMCLFVLTVTVEPRHPYQAVVANPVPPEARALVHPGARLPVRALPGDDNSVAIDWTSVLAANA